MTKFGEQLRKFRQQCNDSHSPHGKLTQEKFGELVGRELGIRYSGAAISDWERGVSKIHADQRGVLISILKVLHHWGGIKTLMECNQLLEAGNYRALDTKESNQIFSEILDGMGIAQSTPAEASSPSLIPFLLENIFSISESELKMLIAKTEEDPPPAWPRVLAAFIRKASDNWSLSINGIMWIWLWLITWWLIAPSLQLPFADRDAALVAMGKYAVGTLIVPLFIGLLVNTKDNDYWKRQNKARPLLVRLYTYQGAGIGFNLGYFLLFPFALLRYYFHFGSSAWIEIAAAALGLVLGNMGAHVVPFNLWRAYSRLALKDGRIFFVIALLGPLWAVFFLEYYPLLLAPVWGIVIILLALTTVVIIAARQSRKQALGDPN
jgi:hypothetical protein